ncbi:U3 small nucleolar ribonucleoprotein protein MPP10-like [Pongo abelii]|uniref:U3 small nucleolar ribonucleoprotein protein MPP10-like n=1 Tax=Pongo abelii TaxID=9601 RepID=UPI00300551A0
MTRCWLEWSKQGECPEIRLERCERGQGKGFGLDPEQVEATEGIRAGSDLKNSSKFDLRKSPVLSDEDSDLDFDINKLEQQSKVQSKGHGKPREKSIVDEKFFQLSEMEACLENREKEEERKDDDEVADTDFSEDTDSDEDEGGLFGSKKLQVKF